MLYSNYLKGVRKCPFCVLSEKDVLKKNDFAFLILAKAPYTRDHLLVVPKRHVLSLQDLTKKEKEKVDELVYLAMNKMHKKYGDVSILCREGNKKRIGKSIDHVHYHIIPKLKIGAVDINLNNRIILDEKDYLLLVNKMKKQW